MIEQMDDRSSSPNSVASFNKSHHQGERQVCCSSREDYTLGEVARSSSHMVIENCPRAAFGNVSQMKHYDFAFIKRTDGAWTYGILAHRSSDDDNDECMMFVINKDGSTKLIRKKQWVEYIRCVAKNDAKMKEKVVPGSISLDENEQDVVSMVTSAS
jgi:hypothetical protein